MKMLILGRFSMPVFLSCVFSTLLSAQDSAVTEADAQPAAVASATATEDTGAETALPKLSQREIIRLTRAGDRLADQGDYLAALGKYTKAYLGVVADIRGQDFKSDVKPNIYNREELGKEMLRLMKEEFSAEELHLMDSSYKALGLIPSKTKSEDVMTKLLTEEVAGFYDPDQKRMVLIVEDGPTEDPGWLGRLLGAGPAFDKDEQKTTLAHELTHALQDQLYDLNAMEAGIEDDDDMMLAFSALVEGDATLLMFAESGDQDISEFDAESMRATFNLMSWMMPLAGGETFRQSPAIFRETLIFPYLQGMLFVLAVAGEDGGWPAVHATYGAPPLSTEQVLHPAKYFDPDQRDVPQTIEIPDLADVLGDGWQHLGGNVLGELQTSIMLKRVRGGSQAAEGWDGDRYEVFENSDGKLALVFLSVWDSEKDAQEFAEAYQAFRKRNADKADVFEADAASSVNRNQAMVTVVEGFSEELVTKIAETVADSNISEKSFPTPAKIVVE